MMELVRTIVLKINLAGQMGKFKSLDMAKLNWKMTKMMKVKVIVLKIEVAANDCGNLLN
jgi:hypothetical protein